MAFVGLGAEGSAFSGPSGTSEEGWLSFRFGPLTLRSLRVTVLGEVLYFIGVFTSFAMKLVPTVKYELIVILEQS